MGQKGTLACLRSSPQLPSVARSRQKGSFSLISQEGFQTDLGQDPPPLMAAPQPSGPWGSLPCR